MWFQSNKFNRRSHQNIPFYLFNNLMCGRTKTNLLLIQNQSKHFISNYPKQEPYFQKSIQNILSNIQKILSNVCRIKIIKTWLDQNLRFERMWKLLNLQYVNFLEVYRIKTMQARTQFMRKCWGRIFLHKINHKP